MAAVAETLANDALDQVPLYRATHAFSGNGQSKARYRPVIVAREHRYHLIGGAAEGLMQ